VDWFINQQKVKGRIHFFAAPITSANSTLEPDVSGVVLFIIRQGQLLEQSIARQSVLRCQTHGQATVNA